MTTVIIGKRLISLDHVALVEPFDPSAHPGMKTDKTFKARLVLIDRQSVLTEDLPDAFAAAHGFRKLGREGIGINPGVRFAVESFVPTPGFEPTKPFRSRLQWRDGDGNTQSKLLLSEPEVVLAVTMGEEATAGGKPETKRKRSQRPTASSDRRKAREPAAQPT